MRKLFAVMLVAVAAFMAVACTSKKQQEETAAAPKALVLYYSQTGTTKAVAEEIAKLTGADIESIELENPYDGDFGATIQRCQEERAKGELPALKPLETNIADYDIIYLGYPIWFGTYAPPITSLLDELSLEGKTLVPFCTFGSGGLEASVRDLKAKFPDVDIFDGYGVRTARIEAMPEEVERFLKENALIEGEVQALPEFSEQQPVGEAETAVFNMACSDYQFPLGTPVTYATREAAHGTEYKFAVDNGTTIYVIAQQDGETTTAEFTKVVR